ncbi:hypothetical protein GIB67_026302 [Kingdonia uniflora]|uniref:Cyclin-like domain-containing protein n=1 Tax=Kingdonia uniflora TaxID=39325 RepID=A0A7J7N600_9MAGN|nr:hypothetical protein GIB67_026302 [Kingdonia uniflora]
MSVLVDDMIYEQEATVWKKIMAGFLSGNPYNISQDKPEEVGRWYLSRKEIEENSPSRRDGIDLKKESYLRKSYCTFLQDLGMRLKVPQVTIATAAMFCHRFFLRQSHSKNDRRIIATVCMFLAGKVEETPRPLKDVILVSYEIIHKKDPAAVQRIKQKELYEQQKELILTGERVVLATLAFDLNVNHPYKPLVEAIKKFGKTKTALAQVAWNFVNDGLRTSLCLQFEPHHIAAGAIFLAAKFLKAKLPADGEKVWWQEFDVTPRQLEEVSNQMLELYEQNRVPSSQGNVTEASAGGVEAGHHASKPATANEPSHLPSCSNKSYGDNQSVHQKNMQNGDADHGSIETTSIISENKGDAMGNAYHHLQPEVVLNNNENRGETLSKTQENDETNSEKKAATESPHKRKREGTMNNDCKDSPVGQSPLDGIKNIDKDKVKAALEKRRKSRSGGDELIKKSESVMDDDDLIERELEDGIELAVAVAEDKQIKQERRQSWSKLSNLAHQPPQIDT